MLIGSKFKESRAVNGGGLWTAMVENTMAIVRSWVGSGL
jgi:hypothetical protein